MRLFSFIKIRAIKIVFLAHAQFLKFCGSTDRFSKVIDTGKFRTYGLTKTPLASHPDRIFIDKLIFMQFSLRDVLICLGRDYPGGKIAQDRSTWLRQNRKNACSNNRPRT
jgi:hypothetical protein